MTQHIDLDLITDYREAVAAATAQLEAGRIVAVPDEVGTLILALPQSGGAVEALSNLQTQLANSDSVITLAHHAVLEDYLDETNRLTNKLASRCWPGPVALRAGGTAPAGLILDWPESAQSWALTDAGRSFIVPGQSFAHSLMRNLSGPALGIVVSGEVPANLDQIALSVRSSEARYDEGLTVVCTNGEMYEIERAGAVSERMLSRLTGEVFLFVCTGNTCRSPMAEGLFRRILADRLHCQEDELLDRGYAVISAGLAAYPGAPASREAVVLLKEAGVDISAHESQPVTEDLLFHSDQILTMTQNHLDAIISSFPELAGKARLLSGCGKDVSDPIGGGADEYRRCRDEIEEYLQELL